MASWATRRRDSVRTLAPSRKAPRRNSNRLASTTLSAIEWIPTRASRRSCVDVADALVDGVLWRADVERRPVDLDVTADRTAPCAEDRFADDSGTGTDQAEQPDDLATRDLEGHVVDQGTGTGSERRNGESPHRETPPVDGRPDRGGGPSAGGLTERSRRASR